eukprot:258178-Pelagomonas_calceolata.AAC.1
MEVHAFGIASCLAPSTFLLQPSCPRRQSTLAAPVPRSTRWIHTIWLPLVCRLMAGLILTASTDCWSSLHAR